MIIIKLHMLITSFMIKCDHTFQILQNRAISLNLTSNFNPQLTK